MITVKQLIERLSAMPPDAYVLVQGYEGGLSTPILTGPLTVALWFSTSEYMGAHERMDYVVEDEDTLELATAVILQRQSADHETSRGRNRR